MMRNLPQQLFVLIIFLLFEVSCKQGVKKNPEDIEKDAPAKSIDSAEPTVFTTKSGKVLELTKNDIGDGLFDFQLIAKGFEFTTDTLIISEADPLSGAFLADLDSNGFEEIYLVTTSGGSGSYGHIHGFSSNADKSITPIYLRPIHETDLTPGELFEGYMGHDSIYLNQGKLLRKFPVYLEGDPNCCPTGGHRILEYQLLPGEANWILKAQIHQGE